MTEFTISEDLEVVMDANCAYVENTEIVHGQYETDICIYGDNYDDSFDEYNDSIRHNGTEEDFIDKMIKALRSFNCREYNVVGSDGKESLDEEGPYTKRSLAIESACDALAEDLCDFYVDEKKER